MAHAPAGPPQAAPARALDHLWDSSSVAAGGRRRDELEENLAAAQIAILLVSADFPASEAITDHQLPRLLAGADTDRLTILPLVVGACAYDASPLEPFQPLNDPGAPNRIVTE